MKAGTVPAILPGQFIFAPMNMYFIGLVAPESIHQQVLKWKLWMKEQYNCQVALRSPAHITLIPPFWMESELENDLINSIAELSKIEDSFSIQLKNFSHFGSRVIFVDIVENKQLEEFKNRFSGFLVAKNKFPFVKDDRPFHPHVTIATRDLYKKSFYEAWEHFKAKEYEEEWMVNNISLLRHYKKNWDVIATSQFK